MKKKALVLSLLILFSCSSNTIYKAPEDLIPKDTMVSLITDMIIATSSKNVKNKNLQRKINYMPFVYDQYKIDSTRFIKSNIYYMSKIDEYQVIFEEVKRKLTVLLEKYKKRKDSLKKKKISIEDKIKLKEHTLEKGFSKDKFLKQRKRATPIKKKMPLKIVKE